MGQTFVLDPEHLEVDMGGGHAVELGKMLHARLAGIAPFDDVLGEEQRNANDQITIWDWSQLGRDDLARLRAALGEIVQEVGGELIPWGTGALSGGLRARSYGALLGAIEERMRQLSGS